MDIETLVSIFGGTAGLLCCIYFLLRNKKSVKLNEKVVLVTGANSGLGKACAEVFYAKGCKVILAGRDLTKLTSVLNKIKIHHQQSSGELAVLKVDLGDLDSLKLKGEEVKAIFGRIDILINNAGISYRGSIEETDIEVHQNVMKVNYFGQIALTQALLPLIKESGRGHIVAISSIQGRLSQGYRSAYSASKHALQAYFDCLRAELWNTDIQVCVVSPGYIQTNLSLNAVCGDGSNYGVMDKSTSSGLPPEQVACVILNAVENGNPEVLPAPLTYRLAVILRSIFPTLMFSIMSKRAKKQCQTMNGKDS